MKSEEQLEAEFRETARSAAREYIRKEVEWKRFKAERAAERAAARAERRAERKAARRSLPDVKAARNAKLKQARDKLKLGRTTSSLIA